MIHLTLADAILLVALVVVAPAYSYYAGIRIAAGRMGSRTRAYGRTVLSWWLIAATMLLLWSRFERPFAILGLTLPLDVRSIAGAAVSAAAIALASRQLLVTRRLPPESLAHLRAGLGRTLAVLPRSTLEYRLFLGVALTAGLCEELLYRGYFLATAASFLTLGGAIAVGAFAFGAGHAYQGTRGMLKTSLAGLLFSLVYVSTGSLLWPIVLHVVTDVVGGTIGYRALRSS
jgi:uncharacterized protein